MKLNVTIENKTYEVEVVDPTARPVIAIVDGESFEVWPESQETAPIPANGNGKVAAAPAAQAPAAAPAPAAPRAPAAPAAPAGGSSVSAPIPGVIISVLVKAGDSVVYGQELCVLEAMKMKNSIRATRAGKIAAVLVAPNDHVKHGQALIQFAD